MIKKLEHEKLNSHFFILFKKNFFIVFHLIKNSYSILLSTSEFPLLFQNIQKQINMLKKQKTYFMVTKK